MELILGVSLAFNIMFVAFFIWIGRVSKDDERKLRGYFEGLKEQDLKDTAHA